VLSLFSVALPQLAYGSAVDTLTLKIAVALACMLLTFAAMSLLVFARKEQKMVIPQGRLGEYFNHGISIVLPAYNEEANIGLTVKNAVDYLSTAVTDYEIIVVNDGSKDNTREVVERLAQGFPRVRLINHPVNRGCGAALVTGFKAATKEFSFYMDADGQFDITDVSCLLPYTSEYDGVFGYRSNRQDVWMRKLNAWGWNRIVRFFFHIKIRDVDCAFKLFKTEYFHKVQLEAKGAMLLTELVFKFDRAGYTFTEVPVRHFPRVGGKGTGAKPAVIVRAFVEMFGCASRWSQI
jgi:glycosyltransferase involved in cell wall biosynthesis